jgi:2-polyprenyl-6-methoxyphenol hydroxylase-like FAD-dependent oxidoreductase
MPQAFTSWESIYETLCTAFDDERYHMRATLSEIEESSSTAISARIEGRERIEADLLIAADGAQSATRRRLLPDVRSSYAGYVAWRGTLDEANAPPELVRFFDDAFTFSEARSGGHILVYFIPGDGADPRPGKRRLNWVWYVGVPEGELPALLTDRNGTRHHASLPLGGTPEATIRSLADLARREIHPRLADLVAATPDPFLQTIVDVVVPRMVFGRICLLGDAAFVVRPHTAGAAAKAARDATVLASSLERASSVESGLARYQEAQLEYGIAMTRYGVALGERWAKTN